MPDNFLARPLELGIVVPTFNERDNIRPFLEGLDRVLEGVRYEVIFVDDDSPDGTAELIRAIGAQDSRVRVLQRIRRRGLASASIEGMMATPAKYIAVMDADMQHDERVLPLMLNKLATEPLDLVVATRHAEGGSMGDFAAHRVFLSNLGHKLSRWVSHADLSDPMSGFFIVKREFVDEVVRSASGVGFKILLDLVASADRPVRVGEVPYTFRERIHGSSKLDVLVGLEYLQLLVDKMIGNLVPARFLIFGMVGAVGVLAALAVFYVAVSAFKMSFLAAQVVATFAAMTGNFFLNNGLTYRDSRLKGWAIVSGLASFYFACSLGAVLNVRVAELAKQVGFSWNVAGACGLAIGAVWNYGVTSFTTWRQGRRLWQRSKHRRALLRIQ
jgi:dolichol-phosphate mannosyltransferase